MWVGVWVKGVVRMGERERGSERFRCHESETERGQRRGKQETYPLPWWTSQSMMATFLRSWAFWACLTATEIVLLRRGGQPTVGVSERAGDRMRARASAHVGMSESACE